MTEAKPQFTVHPSLVPDNEAERLGALRRYNILDTPPEKAFDRITSLAARLLNVPTVLVSLVDESRAWFKSCYGFNQQEVPRDATICSFALLYNELLVVPDARLDERFSCNPFVLSEPGLRFYAGAPLLTQDGFNLGTLCLLDTKPHDSFSDEESATLQDLAALVMDELELRLAIANYAAAEQERQQAEKARQASAQQLQLYADVVRNTQVGLVVWKLENLHDPGSFRLLIANSAASEATGFNFEAIIGRTMAESFPELLRTPLIQQYLEVVQEGRSLDLGEISYGADGIVGGIYSLKAFPLPDHCLGLAFENITARKMVETQLRDSQHYNQQIAEALPGILSVYDLTQQKTVYTNRQVTDLLGYTAEQIQTMESEAVYTLIHPDDLESMFAHFEALQTVTPNTALGIEYRVRHANGSWCWLYSQSVVFNYTEDGLPCQILGVSIDITDRKQSEQDLQESEAWTRLATQVAQLGAWRLHLETNLVEMDERMRQIWGEPESSVLVPLSDALNRMHPGDRERVASAVNSAIAPNSSGAYEVEYRLVWDDGTERWVLAKGQAQFEGEGDSRRAVNFFGTLLDITDRKQAEEALAEKEQRYRYIFDAVNVAIFDEDFSQVKAEIDRLRVSGVRDFERYFAEHPEFVREMARLVQVRDVNLTTLRMFGARHKTELLASIEQVFVPETQATFVGELLTIANGETSFATETVAQTLQGQYLNVWLSISFPPDAESYDHVLVSLLDITERKQNELELLQSEERLALALRAANQGLYDLNVQTGDAIVSPEYARMLGYEPEEFQETNAKWRDRMHPEDVATVYRTYEEYVAGLHSEYRVEFRQRTKTGSWVWILSIGKIISRDENDNPLRMLGTHTDITEAKHREAERKQAQHALQQHSDRLNLLYQTTSELLSSPRPLDLMNQLFSRLSAQIDLDYYYHFKAVEEDGKQQLRLTNYGGISEQQAESFRVLEFGQAMCGLVAQERRQIVVDQATINAHPNAQIICMMGVTAYAGQPLMVSGRLIGTLSFASRTRTEFTPEEITLLQAISDQMAIALDRFELIASLQQQTEDLAKANRIKDEFLAVLSHELRSPLNPILGWTKLLQTGKFDAQKTKQALAVIERNAKQQTQIIDDLLDISKILRGKLTLNKEVIHLPFIVEAALETVRLAAEAKSIQLTTDFDSTLPPVLGDGGRLQQVILNLLSNAVKFTPVDGQVEVYLTQVANEAHIRVKDTGKGIAPEFLPYVFESFRQEDSRTTRQFGGLGLGLAIVRQLTELHGGTVWAESGGEGMGATFTVRLPLMKNAPNTSEDSAQMGAYSNTDNHLRGISVLVVDDEEDMRDLVVMVLEQTGASVKTAASAADALTALDSFRPNLLISDIGMPEMDGYMLIQHVRKRSPEQGGRIPAIALTAYAGEINQQQAQKAGFQRHIAKPVEPDTLVEAIVTLLRDYS